MLYQLLSEGASTLPDQPAVLLAGEAISYAQLAAYTDKLCDGLQSLDESRVGCLIDNAAHLLAVLCAASAIGVEPCVYPSHFNDESLAELAAGLSHETVVSDRQLGHTGIRSVPLEQLVTAPNRNAHRHSDAAPVLILTTGTTGRPKATRHDWTRLVRSVRREDGPGTRWLLTYNSNQFAGMQILLHVLVNRGTLVIPKSRQPGDVVDAIRWGGVTNVSGTPTFWRMLLTQVEDSPADLSLRQITLGGEAVSASLLERLRDAFPEARISHVYAATEFGSTISVSDGKPGLPVSVLDRTLGVGARLRIVDGELHVQSEVGMLGYHDGDDVAGKWMATGDLVEVVDDRILFRGRTNDRINVGGSKVYPIQVEEAIDFVPGISIAVAYGRPNPITGNIVALDVVLQDGFEEESVAAAIREACTALPPAARPRLIRFVEEPAIRGGKALRRPVEAE